MVRPGCPVILLHIFSILAHTRGIRHANIELAYHSLPQLLQFDELLYIIFQGNTQDTLYPYGPGHRDLETPKMDDGSSPEITLLIPFIFFNIPYRSIYVSPEFHSPSINIFKAN